MTTQTLAIPTYNFHNSIINFGNQKTLTIFDHCILYISSKVDQLAPIIDTILYVLQGKTSHSHTENISSVPKPQSEPQRPKHLASLEHQ